MKRKTLLAIMLALCLCVALVSCGGGDTADGSTGISSTDSSIGGGDTTDSSRDEEKPDEPHVHSYGVWQTTKEPTCTEAGRRTQTCSCGDVVTEEIKTTGHIEETVEDKEPTCTKTGLTDGKKCSVCGETTLAQEKIAALGHYYGDDNKCVRCGEIKEPLYSRVDDNTILFGTYPQTQVTDSTLKTTLNSLAGTKPTSSDAQAWTSYGYYISGSVSNYMWYIDIELGGEKYRGVYFTSYRPSLCVNISSSDNSCQYDNGYTTSNIYWFEYEQISWTILNENNGTAFILCDMIIDSQNYYIDSESHTVDGTTVYANNYEYSTIRAWLNDNFYNTAFDELQKEIILTTTVDNSAASTGFSSNWYAREDTEDRVFLLSYKELTTYLTTDESRRKKTTDYAQAQGVDADTYNGATSSCLGNGYWWLRSPYDDYSFRARGVDTSGYVNYCNGSVSDTSFGVVPALQIQL